MSLRPMTLTHADYIRSPQFSIFLSLIATYPIPHSLILLPVCGDYSVSGRVLSESVFRACSLSCQPALHLVCFLLPTIFPNAQVLLLVSLVTEALACLVSEPAQVLT